MTKGIGMTEGRRNDRIKSREADWMTNAPISSERDDGRSRNGD